MKRLHQIEIVNNKVVKEYYPIVIRHNDKVTIIYKDHSLMYLMREKYTGDMPLYPYNPKHEVENLVNNGGKVVHNSKIKVEIL